MTEERLPTDNDLLVQWRAGSASAGETLVERYFQRLYSFFHTKLEHEADELVQATFLACLTAKERFRGDAAFRTFLFGIAKNQLYSALRIKHRDGARLAFDVSSIHDVVSTQRTRMARSEDQARLVDALRRLPVEQQVLLELHYWEDIGIGELATMFEAPDVTIRSRLHRARGALRELLGGAERKLPVRRVAAAMALATVAGACVGDFVETEVVEQELGGSCPPAVCGYNSPEIDHYGLHELEMNGKQNDEGFAIKEFRNHGKPYELSVYRGRLRGHDGSGYFMTGKDLIDAEIVIDHDSGNQYVVRVLDVGVMNFPFSSQLTETYVLEWSHSSGGTPSGDWINVCGEQPVGDTTSDVWWLDTFGQRPVDSLLFEGDRYRLDKMTTEAAADRSWFNIGCSGHTLAKLQLTRNTINSNPYATHAERQATLKMLVGDYCGDGVPFTVAGQRLSWMGGYMTYHPTPNTLEARWNKDGAVCLDVPRMANPTTDEGKIQFPDIWDAIKTSCPKPPPSCANTNIHDFDGAERVSGNW